MQKLTRMRRILALGAVALIDVAAQDSAVGNITRPGPTCEDSLAQQISVTGLNPVLTATYPLSSPIVPTMGFATEDMSAAIDATVVNFMNQYGIPGGVVAMTYNNQLIFAKSYGYSDVDHAVFTQPDSRMRVASISKSLTAMGILKLVHDDPVFIVGGAGWLLGSQPFLSPAFGTAIGGKLQSWIGPITVDELLHHAGGWAEDYESHDTLAAFEKIPGQSSSAPPDCHTLLRYVESRAKTKSDLAPGTAPKYSNIGFCALSEVIHQQSGVDFSDYIQSNVLAPLGMTDTALGSTPRSLQQDREAGYYPCGYSPAKGLPATKVPCGYSTTGELVKGGPSIEGTSVFAPHDQVSPAYGAGYALESLEGAGGYISTAIDLAHFTGAIASAKLPNFQNTFLSTGWPEQFYTYSTEVPPYESFSCNGYYGMGWDKVQPCAVVTPFVSYDNFNFIKGGGFAGTQAKMAATANGYGFGEIFNGDVGADLSNQLEDILWPVALPAAVNHAAKQPWTIDFSPQFAQPYSSWMGQSAFASYLASQASLGFYPSRLEGRTQLVPVVGRGFIESYEFRGRFGPLPGSGDTSPAAPQYMYAQSCPAVLAAVKAAPASTPLVSLQRFTDTSTGAYVYQAVWASPIPQLP